MATMQDRGVIDRIIKEVPGYQDTTLFRWVIVSDKAQRFSVPRIGIGLVQCDLDPHVLSDGSRVWIGQIRGRTAEGSIVAYRYKPTAH